MDEEKKMEKTNAGARSSRGKKGDHLAVNAGDLSAMTRSDTSTQAGNIEAGARPSRGMEGDHLAMSERDHLAVNAGDLSAISRSDTTTQAGNTRAGSQTMNADRGERQLDTPNLVVPPGDDREGQTSRTFEGGMQEMNRGVRTGDTATQTEERRIPSKTADQSRHGVGMNLDEDLKGREKSRRDSNL